MFPSTLFFEIECVKLAVEVEIMNGLIEFLTTEEMIVVYSLIGIASVLYFIIYFLDRTYYKRKQRQNTRELNKIVDELGSFSHEDVKEEILEPVLVTSTPDQVIETSKETLALKDDTPILTVEEKIEPMIETLDVDMDITKGVEEVPVLENKPMNQTLPVEDKKEELQYTSIEPDVAEAQAELMKLTETLEKAEQEVKNIELTAFEEEQEQNAIISLDELMARGRAMYESGELDKFEDEGNEPISLQDLENRMKEDAVLEVEEVSKVPEQMVLDDFQTVAVEPIVEKNDYQEHKKFQSSPIISPVYGIEKTQVNSSSDLELENTANYEKLDDEIRKTNEFLMTLKELQKNLD